MTRRPAPRRASSARERVAALRAARRRTGCGPLWAAGLALATLLALTLLFTLGRAGQSLGAIEQADPRRPVLGTAVPAEGGLGRPFTVLLLGVDRREAAEEGARSDTLIVAHVNPAGGWASMLSIPRDTAVDVPGLGVAKVNAAYSHGYANAAAIYGEGVSPAEGGGALAAETVGAFLGIKIDYIAQIDFQGFERVVDTLGGVTVDVEQPLLDPNFPTDDYGVERVYVPAGLQVMDGATALRYARSRHSTSDFDRARRQQQILSAILDEVRRRGMLDQAALLPELLADLEQSVSTTLPLRDPATLSGLAELARSLSAERIVRLSLNPDEVGIVREAGSDIYWDRTGVALQVSRLLSGPGAAVEVARVQVQNGAGVRGLAGRVSEGLRERGFVVNEPADAGAAYPQTLIIDFAGRPEARARLAATLGLSGAQVLAEPGPDSPPRPLDTDILVIVGADYEALRGVGGP